MFDTILPDAGVDTRASEKNNGKLNWFALPGEIRDQIYETLLPFEVNFVYKSPWMFPNYDRTFRGAKKISTLPGGLTFEFSPFPKPAIQYYSQVSRRFGSELSDCLDRQRHRVLKALEDCTSGTESWNTDFDSEKITPKLLGLVSRSRFIFSSFGCNTENIIAKLDKRIKNNVRDVFITQSLISSVMPGNKDKWTFASASKFGKLFEEEFPNLEKVAVGARQSRKDTDCLRAFVDWYDAGVIKQLEVVYPRRRRDATGEIWGWPYEGYKFKDEATIEDCYELLWKFTYEEREPERRWKVQRVDDDEVNERGRFFINFEYPYASWEEVTMVEGTVFRLTKEPIGTFDRVSTEEDLEFLLAYEEVAP